MRRFKIAFVATFLTFGLLAAPLYGADVAKIGIVDFQRILETSSAGKIAQAEISKQGNKIKADLEERGAAIDEIRKKLEREELVMSKEMRQEREREIRIKINDFKSLEKKYRTDFQELEKRLVYRIQGDIFNLVEDVAKKGGYLLVLEKRQGGVLYNPKTIEITDNIIQMYNAKFAQKENEEGQTEKK